MTNKTPNNPNPPRPRILSNADFKALANLALYDRTEALPVAISKLCGTSPRSIERWLASDEKVAAPPDVIKSLLQIAKTGDKRQGFLKAIETNLKEKAGL